jgi:hypothetical protein
LTNGCTIGSIATAGRYGRGRKREARYRLDLRRDITRINEYAFWRLVDPVLWLTIPKLLRRFQWNPYARRGRNYAAQHFQTSNAKANNWWQSTDTVIQWH